MTRITPYLLWAALVATLIGTLTNTTWAFATVNGGNVLWGGVQAVAADLGLVALAATLAERRAQGERATWLWIAVAGFVSVSTYASYLHSYAQATALDAPGAALRPLLLGAFLPLMLFALVEVVSHARRTGRTSDAPAAQSGMSALAERNERAHDTPLPVRIETESVTGSAAPSAHSRIDAPILVVSAAQSAQAATESAPTANGHKEPCAQCGVLIGASQQARAAHKRFCVAPISA